MRICSRKPIAMKLDSEQEKGTFYQRGWLGGKELWDEGGEQRLGGNVQDGSIAMDGYKLLKADQEGEKR